MGILGVAVALPGKEQDVIKSPEISIITEYLKIFLTSYLNFNLHIPPKS
jgi:hypothetical protein